MLHEEEFFDAIDATLDKWDKEEEKVLQVMNSCTLWLTLMLVVYGRLNRQSCL